MSVSESCKSRRGGRSKGAGATLVSVTAKQPQLSSEAGISIQSSRCDGAAAATEVQHLPREASFPPPSNVPGPCIPLTQRLEQRQEGCASVAAAAKGEVQRKAFPSCRTLPPVAPSLNPSSRPEAETGRDSGVAADSQPASKVKSCSLVDKMSGTTTDIYKPISLRAPSKTFAPAYNSAAASAVAAAATPLSAVTRVMHAPATTGGCETRSDTITAATAYTTQAAAVHVAASSRVVDVPAPVAAPAAAVAAGRDFISVDAHGFVCGAEKYDGIAGGSAHEAAVSNGGAEETADLEAWERQLLLQSPGALVLQQAPAGVSRAELSEFFRRYGPLQPPGDGLYFPNSRRQQLLVRFQRLQDAAKCVRLLQQQQQRRQLGVRGAFGGHDDAVSGMAAPSGSGASAGALNKAAEGGEYGTTHGLQQQSTDLQDVLQQHFHMPSVSTSSNTTASRQQGGVKNDAFVNEADCCEEGNRSLSSFSLLGCASLQLSRADKIKISALRGYRRAVQLLRSEGILQSLQQQQQQHRAEQKRGEQEGQSQLRKPQEQQTARLSSTHDRVQQITASAKEREGSLLQMRSMSVISAAPGSAGPAAPAQQQEEVYVGTQKAVSTTQESAAAPSAAPRKRGSATVGGTAKGEKSVSPSRAHDDEEKEGRVKRRVPQQMQLLGENSSDATVTLTTPSAATRQQQPKHAASGAAVAGATGVSRNIASAAAASRGKAVRQSSSNSLLELLSGAAVVEHLEKEEAAAAAAAGWGNSGTGGQNSKLQQQRSQTAGWGEATALDPVHDAERIHHLRARSEAAHGAMMGSLAGFLFFQDNLYENFLIPALPRSVSFAVSGYPPAASASAYPPPPG